MFEKLNTFENSKIEKLRIRKKIELTKMYTLGLLGYGWLDLDKVSINLVSTLSFALLGGLLGRALVTSGEANESEPMAAVDSGDSAELLKVFLQHLGRRVLGEIADIDFCRLDGGMSTIGVIFVNLMAGIGSLNFHLMIIDNVSIL